jgi:hypothetical protein
MKNTFLIVLLFLGFSQYNHAQDLTSCKAWLQNDTLRLENGKVFQYFWWNQGNLIRIGFGLQSTKQSVVAPDNKPAFSSKGKNMEGNLSVKEQAATLKTEAYLKAEVTCKTGNLQIKRVFRLSPDCPAIACDLYLRGDTLGSSMFRQGSNEIVSDRFSVKGVHWFAKSVEFFDVTDRNNTLVREYNLLGYATSKFNRAGYKHENQLRGNLLLLENGETEERIFILKEAPCSSVQLNYPGYDFTIVKGEVKVVGLGVIPSDLNDSAWVKAYGSVVGISSTKDEFGVLSALKDYQKTKRIMLPGRDEMIMANTWGDLSKDSRVNEAFAFKELEAGYKLGITHLQLDDGWQAGRSGNSMFKGGSFENIWKDNTYWQPHPERFPNGLEPIVKRGNQLGIEIGLWFNPDRTNSNANWEKDANILIGLYKKYGIHTFKIDGVDLPDKVAENNFRNFLDKISIETNYNVVFNLDVTAGRRGGYHYFNEYGNLFLENRFTDWRDYFPYTTLRNIWMLSKYVPTQNLQVEFLNNSRNAAKYGEDPFAPQNYSFDYCFAISLVAQPLAWFETSGLDKDVLEKGGLVIKKYREIMNDFHGGNIFPIGDEPNGRSWTGFQSIQNGKGYMLVFREINNDSRSSIKTWLTEGKTVSFIPIIGKGKPFAATVGKGGELSFELPEKNSYALYSYSVK